MDTLVINNFAGRLTRYNDGDINSGFAKYSTTFGNNPFENPGNLTWFEVPIQIDSAGNTFTDLVTAAKVRDETTATRVYAIGSTGRFYGINVNNPGGSSANSDTPSLLATLTYASSLSRGGSLDFFGATEQVYIGHNAGVLKVNFDGSGETSIAGTWDTDEPRFMQQFLGKEYVSNGRNILEIASTGLTTNSARLSPGLPQSLQVQDLDLSPDGTYLTFIGSPALTTSTTLSNQNISFVPKIESYIFKWNGIDAGYTALDRYSGAVASNIIFGRNQNVFGNDFLGTELYNPTEKILSLPYVTPPLPNAISNNGNLLIFTTTEFSGGVLKASTFAYGALDAEVGPGLFRLFRQSASDTETDVLRVPMAIPVSNQLYTGSQEAYTNEIAGDAKLYYSTLEKKSGGTDKNRFYKFHLVPTGSGTAMAGVYETQTQLFSKKVRVSEVRIYGEPWVANNSFTIELIGSSGGVISGSSKTFTAGSNLTVGDDFAWYSPDMAPTYAIGVRITNAGSVNHVITKIEIDTEPAGK